MKTLIAILLLTAFAATAVAADLGNVRPAKPNFTYPPNPPNPARQGGDTILNAVAIPILYSGTGTTEGFTDDYDEVCPYTFSDATDVVYSLTPEVDVTVTIDMWGSAYDTKIYVYDEDLNVLACNDDYYPDYTSMLENVALVGGSEYYLIIDGYAGSWGEYVVNITEYVPCVVECPPPPADHENEPPLVDGYVDEFNGGCLTDTWSWIDELTYPSFCGKSGWYLGAGGSQYRDTDWFKVVIPTWGYFEITGDAEYATYMFELGPTDCDQAMVIQEVIIGPCQEGTINIVGVPGNTTWFWVGPTNFDGVGEYDYVLRISPWITATESTSWSSVKKVFE